MCWNLSITTQGSPWRTSLPRDPSRSQTKTNQIRLEYRNYKLITLFVIVLSHRIKIVDGQHTALQQIPYQTNSSSNQGQVHLWPHRRMTPQATGSFRQFELLCRTVLSAARDHLLHQCRTLHRANAKDSTVSAPAVGQHERKHRSYKHGSVLNRQRQNITEAIGRYRSVPKDRRQRKAHWWRQSRRWLSHATYDRRPCRLGSDDSSDLRWDYLHQTVLKCRRRVTCM